LPRDEHLPTRDVEPQEVIHVQALAQEGGADPAPLHLPLEVLAPLALQPFAIPVPGVVARGQQCRSSCCARLPGDELVGKHEARPLDQPPATSRSWLVPCAYRNSHCSTFHATVAPGTAGCGPVSPATKAVMDGAK